MWPEPLSEFDKEVERTRISFYSIFLGSAGAGGHTWHRIDQLMGSALGGRTPNGACNSKKRSLELDRSCG